jgi:hypothetical protein
MAPSCLGMGGSNRPPQRQISQRTPRGNPTLGTAPLVNSASHRCSHHRSPCHRPPSRATTQPPRARLARSASGWKVMLSPGHRVVGLRQTDEMSHQRARSTHGPSSSCRTPRHIEKPGEVARAFLVVNLGAPLRWRLGGSPGWTSWPVSRIL